MRTALLATMALALAGCSVTTTTAPVSGPGSGMMGSGSGGMRGARAGSTACAVPTLAGTTVQVTLMDMGMMSGSTADPAPLGARMALRASTVSVPAGQVSFVATAYGWRTHELVVLPLAAGERAGQRVPGQDGKVDESGSLGEASASCAEGSGEGIDAGTTGWVTLTLAPGRYELLCNMANHYADGMWQELVVT
ncbi:MAG TPA: sulfocyanin-like copper-binding protein [Candidatus Nanopelagicales bacterium]|nr:sulfocyanin-like copper-binding protein [Candidatus Nanopelagicales bacterium]